jgi:hypothetical protein
MSSSTTANIQLVENLSTDSYSLYYRPKDHKATAHIPHRNGDSHSLTNMTNARVKYRFFLSGIIVDIHGPHGEMYVPSL